MTIRLLIINVLLLLSTALCNTIFGQQLHNLRQAEDSLCANLSTLNRATTDSSRNAINLIFSNNLYAALLLSGSDTYPFDSLKNLVKLTSPDNFFRFFHWNLRFSDGKYRYYGFLKVIGHTPPIINRLYDASDSLSNHDTAQCGSHQGFCALYYKVITGETSSGQKVYTILGWSGTNSLITQKVIYVLSFDEQSLPIFGM